ncbi:MAG: hypothetical protein FWD57_03425, partial [Polyangiaceae bacterium]|nr:hypothetical protein [Polyangiaceae bacterium]
CPKTAPGQIRSHDWPAGICRIAAHVNVPQALGYLIRRFLLLSLVYPGFSYGPTTIIHTMNNQMIVQIPAR